MGSLKSTQDARVRTLTPFLRSCSPNFSRAQYFDMRTLTHELIVTIYICTGPSSSDHEVKFDVLLFLMSAIRQLPHFLAYCLMKLCYPLTYRKLQNFQTTELNGKNWENSQTMLKDLQCTNNAAELYRDLTHTFVRNYILNTFPTLYFKDWRSAVSICHKNRAKITVHVCEQKPYPV